MKPTNSPTQGQQPNPRKIRLKAAFGPLFFSPTAKDFSWVKIGFMQQTDYKTPNPTNFSANTLLIVLIVCYDWGGKVWVSNGLSCPISRERPYFFLVLHNNIMRSSLLHCNHLP